MALPSTTGWCVRSDGNNLNGGGYVRGSSGTDFSNQASPQLSNTDLVIDGADATKASSAGAPLTATHIGNLLQVSAGSGFTPGHYRLISVATGVGTFDRALGTVGSTGGTFRLGGSVLTIDQAFSNCVAGNRIHIKDGSYSKTSARVMPNFSDAGAGPLTLIGFGTIPEDGGTKPVITSATNSVNIFEFNAGNHGYKFKNLKLTHTAGTRGDGLYVNSDGVRQVFLEDVIIDGCNRGIYGDWNVVYLFYSLFCQNVEIKNSVSHGIINSGYTWLVDCWLHANGGNGYDFSTRSDQNASLFALRSNFSRNTGRGIYDPSTSNGLTKQIAILNSILEGNTSDGFKSLQTTAMQLMMLNNIIYGNGAYGVNFEHNLDGMIQNDYNAYGANVTAARNNLSAGAHDVALAGDPFTAIATDYSITDNALIAAGFPGLSKFGQGRIDIGALQTAGGGGGGMLVHPGMNGGLRG